MLLARTTIATGPAVGATSTATTATPAFSAVFNTVPAAADSKGEKMIPLAPRLMAFCTPVICFAVSNSELNGCRRSIPWALASATMYLLYEVQNGEVRVVRSTPTLGPSACAARAASERIGATSAAFAVERSLDIDFPPLL